MTFDWDGADAARIIAEAQAEWTAQGPDAPPPGPDAPEGLRLAAEQHARNHRLWREEDKARDPRADDAVIAAVKRRIDRLNQERNDLVERLDDDLAAWLAAHPAPSASADAPERWLSETPGAMIDRLSILALKIHYMGLEAGRDDADDAHRARCAGRVEVLRRQRADLCRSLAWALADLASGRRAWRSYKQFKMYNDPSTNAYMRG